MINFIGTTDTSCPIDKGQYVHLTIMKKFSLRITTPSAEYETPRMRGLEYTLGENTVTFLSVTDKQYVFGFDDADTAANVVNACTEAAIDADLCFAITTYIVSEQYK